MVALIYFTLAPTKAELRLPHWPGCLRPARVCQTGWFSLAMICQAEYLFQGLEIKPVIQAASTVIHGDSTILLVVSSC